MAFRTIGLRKFLQDEDAPDGFAYLWNDDPVFQIHLFSDEYTIFWIGNISGTSLREYFFRMVDYANVVLIEHGLKQSRDCTVEVVSTYADGDQKIRNSELPLRAYPSNHSVNEIVSFLEFYKANAVATYFTAWLIPTRRWYLELWGDTQLSKDDFQEVGLTSNLPISVPICQDLFSRTSRQASTIPADDSRDMFKNQIYQHTMRFFTK